ncbi:ABC transporter ATP-binding protein [Legionella oakridgensis]|uniref:ABC-type multidrug transport system, ATPase and permease component n=2 Tax=Legionella oakridgensis TaxID=29423 RepID=W0BE98_9GAMM|nr:ABC transporter ATP-binding protein [Legionella oakridgensis]AHE67031.1 ABC-type multidrug transport system, ATPase and permease component [Legionella oakridgensis ATCC 33761 = DSM 21215]ETO93317.1 ABC-type multidrug transport system, ATPase and permease components [Legionella oakridgensis RV-2-2007]KTD37182.1 multidrug ABC transporter ATPase/permease [Legionella oakridgensis]STY20127.1 multidrug ABC transporter ATPase/permease [Legionella longbeachae]
MANNHHAPQSLTIWGFLWTIIKPYRWWYVLMLQAPLVTALYVFANNYSLKLLIDAFSMESIIDYHHLIYPIVLFITAQIVLDLSWRVSNIAEWKAEPFARRRLLLKTYDYIQYHSYTYFQNNQSGTVISKLKGILDGYDSVFDNIHHIIGKNFCVVILSILVLWLINTTVFLFMLAWCILVVSVLYPMALRLNQLSNEVAESKHHVIGLLSDNITNIFSLFYFATRKIELKRADSFMSKDYVPRQISMYRYDFVFNFVGSILYWIMLISVFLFMIHLRTNASISTGDFVFVMLTAIAISFELWGFISAMCKFMKDIGDFKSSFSVLTTPHTVIDRPDAIDLHEIQGAIEFKNLFFAYEGGKPIFTDLNLTIRAGEKIGLIGHSGAGKSTLISLLLKNFQPSSGNILIDGQDIDAITSDSLRKQISLIPQDIMLFHRSIAENIGYAKETASLQDIKKAAKMANIDEYIDSLPDGYHTLVGERGIKLSGGQRQRIAIARAILKHAPIIILDEATSSLDTATEQQIQQSLNLILEENKTTVIAIAHRLSTIRHMDRIVVMEEGHIVEEGSFNQLMNKKNGYFRQLWDNQVNGMVL